VKVIIKLFCFVPLVLFATLGYAFSGGTGTKADPYLIRNCPELQNIINFPTADFLLIDYVNCNGFDYGDGKGFMPLGNLTSPFTGKFDGNNFKISYIKINRNLQDNVGIFGVTLGAEITNVNFDNVTIIGKSYVGTLVGLAKVGTKISNVYAAASQIDTVASQVGGLVGRSEGNASVKNTIQNASVDVIVKASLENSSYVGGMLGTVTYSDVSNSHALGAVSGNYAVGGLVGRLEATTTLLNTNAQGLVNGASNVGGLVGSTSGSSHITNSYATGNVVVTYGDAGGLLGADLSGIQIDRCYATGNVESLSTSTSSDTGGLVGNFVGASGVIKNSYATGALTNNYGTTGGLVGWLSKGSVSNSYSVGRVSGTNSWAIGGLIGVHRDGGSVVSSYWDKTTSGQNGSANGVGKTTAEMHTQSTYVGWDFNSIWYWSQGQYPTLR